MLKIEKSRIKNILFKILLSYIFLILAYTVSLNLFILLILIFSSAVIFFAKSTEESIAYYIGIIPFSNILSINYEFSKSYFFIIAMVFALRLLVFRKVNYLLLIQYILFVLYSLIVALYTTGISFSSLITFLIYIPFIFLVSNYTFRDLKIFTISGAYGFIIASSIGLLKNKIPLLARALRSSSVDIGGNITSRFSGISYDANYFGVTSVFYVSLLLLLFSYTEKRKEKLLYGIMLLVISFYGMFSYSKAFLLTLIFVLLYYYVFYLKLNPFKLGISLSLIYIVNLILLYMLNFSLYEFISSRIFSKATNLTSFTTHRNILWKEYLEYIFSSVKIFFFGSGVNAGVLNIQVAHNFYIELLYLFGFIGTFLLIAYIFMFYKETRRIIGNKNINFFQYTPLFSVLIAAFSLNYYTVTEIFTYVFLSLLSCTIILKEELKIE